MLYVISGEDVPNSLEKRMAVRSEHLKRLQLLQEEGRLILAGPHPAIDNADPGPAGFSGSLIVAEFDSLQAAKNWAEADPYVSTGIYENYSKTLQKGITDMTSIFLQNLKNIFGHSGFATRTNLCHKDSRSIS